MGDFVGSKSYDHGSSIRGISSEATGTYTSSTPTRFVLEVEQGITIVTKMLSRALGPG